MTSPLRSLLDAASFDSTAPARWVQPDLGIIDDVHGPAALRLLAEHFGAHASIARPDQIQVTSTIDLENAMPDRIRAHEALSEFATHHRLRFTHELSSCADGCAPSAAHGSEWLIATARKPDSLAAAKGCVSVQVQPMDLAGLLATGSVWAGRPRVQCVRIDGSLGAGTTVHDLAIALRPQLSRGVWARLHWPSCGEESLMLALCSLLLGDSPAQNVFAASTAPSASEPETVINAGDLRPLLGEAGQLRRPSDMDPTDVDRVYIGSCTTGSVADLRLAAEVMKGQRVHVPTVISPASMRDLALLREVRLGADGPSLEDLFRDAGCDLGLPGCASCVNAIGDAQKPPTDGETLTVVATAVASVSTRRMARVLTASPITAAQIALHGRIGGPRVRPMQSPAVP